MSSMRKAKEGIHLKKLFRLKNTDSIFVIASLLMIFVIASYTYILQSSYTKTALETEIARDTASADAVHKLVDGRICKEDFDQINDQSDEKEPLYKDISSYFNEIRTLNSTRYIYTAKKNEEGKLVYVVDGLDPNADDVRHPGDYIEDEMVPYIDRAISGENVYSQDIIDTTWGPIFTACYPVSANHDGTGEIIGAFCIEMDMQSAYGMVEKTNHISIICGLVAGAVLLLICLYTYNVYQKSKAEEQKQKDAANARTQYKGTGLGMAITKKYVDMMGGSIAVESKKGVGSTFTVDIPMELTEQVIQSEQKQHLHRDLTDIHVLMAEDNDLNAELATIILEDAGMTVTRASDGKEVVDLFKNHPRGTYDLILMDIMMPNMDGHQATKAIRALGTERPDAVTIPIIALSANAFVDDIQESLDSGMNDHISKPINMEELIDTITKYIKHD